LAAAAAALGACALVGNVAIRPAHAAASEDWPQFHGPRRDNISTETGLLKKWPPGGPKLLWTARGIGFGYSTVAIAEGLIYTTGNIAKDTVITALDLDGRVQWQVKNGPAYRRAQPGTRSTPTIEKGRLYHENADGDVVCLEAKTGKVIWSLNILRKFKGRNIQWALAESLLIHGDNVICTPGGAKAGFAALNKTTGETVWVCEGPGDKPGYCSPILVEYKGLRQIVTLMSKAAVGVNADTGELLWRLDHVTPFDENIVTPVYHDGHIFVTSGHRVGGVLLKLNVEGNKCSIQEAWRNKDLDTQHGGVVLVDGCLYGFVHGRYKWGWACVDFKTGRTMHAERTPTQGSITYADGMLYTMDEKGTVSLVKPTPEARVVVSQFQIPRGGKRRTWAHPVVCGGRLYIRHGDFLYAYDIKAK